MRIPRKPVLWIVWEVEHAVGCGLERIAVVCAGRIARRRDRDTVPKRFSRVVETAGRELGKEPAILELVIEHYRIAGGIRAVWHGEARPERTGVYCPRQQVAGLVIDAKDQVDDLDIVVRADFPVGVGRVHTEAEYVKFVLIRQPFEGQQRSRDGWDGA